ncbi:MAG: GHKL domain-containing protein, partial [Lachnospiraceae bacterium]|nr:GHKL domain-containing protein [Lachnospiraceae bacterium]
LFVAIIGGISAFMTYLVIEENIFILENFYHIFSVIQLLWNLSFHGVFLILLYKVIRSLKRNFSAVNREFDHVQTLFLFVPSITGLCFSILLRSILYTYNENRIGFLMDEYPETRFLIPMISGLCLLSIMLSAVILRKLVESSEKEAMVEIYRNRIGDMEEHMKDIERLYDGIRGMRHDMKNCIADLEILMRKERESAGDYGDEIRSYLDGLCVAMDELDMKCSTGNPVTDVVISRKMRKMEEKDISFVCDFLFPEKLGISAFDISILLNNGLDNALEASEKEKQPFIHLSSYSKGNMFFIEIRNTFTGILKTKDGGNVFQTSKSDTSIHGLGIKNMRSCAEKYYGTLRCESRDGEFLLAVMLQGKENEQ